MEQAKRRDFGSMDEVLAHVAGELAEGRVVTVAPRMEPNGAGGFRQIPGFWTNEILQKHHQGEAAHADLIDRAGFEIFVWHNTNDAATKEVRTDLRLRWSERRHEHRLAELLVGMILGEVD